MLAGMEPIDEMLRQSGHYGPKVEPPPGADATTRPDGALVGRPVLTGRRAAGPAERGRAS